MTLEQFQRMEEYLQQHAEIREVILSGGEPLLVQQDFLRHLLQHISQISGIEIIRIHTRMPVSDPLRINSELLQTLNSCACTLWMVIHVNCAAELSTAACAAIRSLTQQGIPLLAQTVLLRGVNDSLDSLLNLLQKLIANRVKPYYLHYPDLVPGTNHFRIPLEQAIELVSKLRSKISGFAIPELIVDIPGGLGKIVLQHSWATRIAENIWEFTSPLTYEKIQVHYPQSLEN